jgi:hypothetical protein
MNKILFKFTLCLLLIAAFSCKKDSNSLDNMILEDGEIVFQLDGTDWVVKDMVASFSNLVGISGGEMIAFSGSVPVSLDTYKTIFLFIMDTGTIGNKDYAFTGSSNSGSKIDIDEGKTLTTGIKYNTTNPDDATTGTGKITITNYDRQANKISGSFSGEIFKTSYTDNTNTGWIKTSIKSGRFSNIPVIMGK